MELIIDFNHEKKTPRKYPKDHQLKNRQGEVKKSTKDS